MSTRVSAETHVYRMQGWRQFFLYFVLAVGIGLLLMCIILPVSGDSPLDPAYYPWLLALGFFLFDACLWAYLAGSRVRLITSPGGIEYYGAGITVRAAWSDVIGFAQVRQGNEYVNSLMVRTQAEMSAVNRASLAIWPVLKPIAMLAAVLTGRWYMLGQDFDAEGIASSIPVGMFSNEAPGALLEDDIRRYAPQAYGEAVPETRAPATAPDSRARNAAADSRLNGRLAAIGIIGVELLAIFLISVVAYGIAQPGFGGTPPGKLWLDDAGGEVTLSADGKTLVAAAPLAGTRVLNFPQGDERAKLEIPGVTAGEGPFVESVAASPDGKLIAVGGSEGAAYLWSVAPEVTLRQVLSVTPPIPILDSFVGSTTIGYIYSVAFSPDGSRIAAIGPTGGIKLWNTADGTPAGSFKAAKTAARLGDSAKLLFGADGKTLYSLVEGTLEAWSLVEPDSHREIDPGDWVEDMSLSADGKSLALGTLYGGVYLWDIDGGKISHTFAEHGTSLDKPAAYGIALSPDGQTVAVGYSGGNLKLWHADGSIIASFRQYDNNTIRWMAFTPDSKTFIYQKYNDESIWTWDLTAK